MSQGTAALDAMIRSLRGIRGIANEIAAEAAPLVQGVVRASAAAGRDLNGKPWPPKRDGTRALPDAASAVTAQALGSAVVVTLTGAYVYHDSAEGPDRRRILPDTGAGLPAPISDALTEAATRVFQRRMAGGR